jgi:hypothetical protein
LASFSAPALTLLLLLAVGSPHLIAQGDGSNHSQNIQRNNGVAVQNNVKIILRNAARNSMLDERGWMRLLTPANEKDPANPCADWEAQHRVDETTVRIFYGTNATYCRQNTCDIVVAERASTLAPLLTIHRVKNGLLVDAKIFDKDGNLIAKIEKNKTFVNRNFASDFNRPDEHTVWIKDNHDKQVLYIRFLNKTSLYIEGIFNIPDEVRAPITPHVFLEVTKDYSGLRPGGGKISGSCSADNADAIGIHDPE